ncbi:MAG: hypothetical protein H8D26_04125 [Methanomicrobia archaeon]|nr:hypothetical protein [Methanomicrobia archaeon]
MRLSDIPHGDSVFIDANIFLSEILKGVEFSKEFGLLSNDALHLAVMTGNNLVNLASNDPDFEGVDWINLCKP